jgi:hypothetical protein
MPQKDFGQTYCNDLPKRILKKFTFHFPRFILLSMAFRSLYEILEI